MNNIHHSLESLAIDIDKLSFLEGNPRKGDIEAVAKSYKQFGQRKPIVATKDYVVIAGNHQLAAARQLGWDKIAVVITDDDELTAKAFALADNRTAELGSYDDDLLADLLSEVSSVPELMDSTGFSEDDLFDLIGFDDESKEEKEIELPTEAKSKLGDKYQLGNHILYCNDYRNIDIDEVDCIFTDPPYGINYKAMRDSEKDKEILNDNPEDFSGIITPLLENIKASSYFICCDWRSYPELYELMNYFNKKVKSLIVWNKKSRVQNLDLFAKQHEFIVYSGKFGGEKTYATDVWDFNREFKISHLTPKPTELIKFALGAVTKVNNTVLDVFAGSGSTLIACEEIKRNCIAVELDPLYCDLIIERWENLTGQKAELIEKGQDAT
jgi:site-specific DNA-methyltransferase (adenine-specific)